MMGLYLFYHTLSKTSIRNLLTLRGYKQCLHAHIQIPLDQLFVNCALNNHIFTVRFYTNYFLSDVPIHVIIFYAVLNFC